MEKRRKSKKLDKNRGFFSFPVGKYVIGTPDYLFENPKMTKKILSLVKKNKFGHDENLNIYYFYAPSDFIEDAVEKNVKIDILDNLLVLCDASLVKEGKIKGCKKFSTKENFSLNFDYTKEDFCFYFYYNDYPSPFMMLFGEVV